MESAFMLLDDVAVSPAATLARSAGARVPTMLVAVHDSPASEGALRVAAALAGRTGAHVEVMTVFEPDVVGRGGHRTTVDPYGLAAAAAGARRRMRTAVPERLHWPMRIESGSAAPVIARVAREVGAGLVVVGVDPSDPAEHAAGDNIALRLAEFTDVPLLAVARHAAERHAGALPRNALVFVEPAPDAAPLHVTRAALGVLDERSRLHFVSVRPGPRPSAADDRLAGELALWCGRFDALDAECARGLDGRRGCRVLLTGDPERELFEFAGRSGMDVVAAAVHGRTRSERTRHPNPGLNLLRAAPCSVLLVPID